MSKQQPATDAQKKKYFKTKVEHKMCAMSCELLRLASMGFVVFCVVFIYTGLLCI